MLDDQSGGTGLAVWPFSRCPNRSKTSSSNEGGLWPSLSRILMGREAIVWDGSTSPHESPRPPKPSQTKIRPYCLRYQALGVTYWSLMVATGVSNEHELERDTTDSHELVSNEFRINFESGRISVPSAPGDPKPPRDHQIKTQIYSKN